MLIEPDDTPLQLTAEQAARLRNEIEILSVRSEDEHRMERETQLSPAVERLLNCEPVMYEEFSEHERVIVNLADAITDEPPTN